MKFFDAFLSLWPITLPRTCRVYLDKQTSWPYRFEWWGPVPAKTEDVLLLQMEFRNPRRSKPDASAFTFDAGGEKVDDKTAEKITRIIQARNRLQSMSKGGTTPLAPGK